MFGVTMTERYLLFLLISLGLCSNAGVHATAQDSGRILVNVNLVQLNVAGTDNKGRYIQGLNPQDFIISEDKIPQKMATFEEGNGPTRSLIDEPPPTAASVTEVAAGAPDPNHPHAANAEGQGSFPQLTGANVFIL